MQRGEKVKEGGERERGKKKDGVRKGDPVLSFILFFFVRFFEGSCLSVLSVCGCMCVCVRVCFLLSFSSSFQSLHSFFLLFHYFFSSFFILSIFLFFEEDQTRFRARQRGVVSLMTAGSSREIARADSVAYRCKQSRLKMDFSSLSRASERNFTKLSKTCISYLGNTKGIYFRLQAATAAVTPLSGIVKLIRTALITQIKAKYR